jgi:uncharacterized membrane protein
MAGEGTREGARPGTDPLIRQLICAAILMALSAALRLGGLYSDIALLYSRDQLWRHPIPYIDYPNEYPVGIGALSWALSYLPGGQVPYLLATAAVMLLAGLLVVWLGRQFAGARPWLLALSPALLCYTALNWDMLAILLLVVAFLALRRGHDAAGGGLLAAAVWTKFFPIVVVPLVILDHLLRRRWRDAAAFGLVFGLVSLAMNVPFALSIGPGGVRLRDGWLRFFTFNQARQQEANLWALIEWGGGKVSPALVNRGSAVLLLAGLGVVALLLAWAHLRAAGPAPDLLLPASAMALGWWFFINKVYSPQYSLWLVVLLALLGAPTLLAIGFGLADFAWFVAILVAVAERGWSDWMHAPVLLPPLAIREAAILAVVVWAAGRVVRAGLPARRRGLPEADPIDLRRPAILS